MKQTKRSGGKSAHGEVNKSRKVSNLNNSATKMFMFAALDLSWQMVIVVLVPLIGGFELDKHLGTTPVLTIIGFILAMVGTFVVIKRVLKSYNDSSLNDAKEQK